MPQPNIIMIITDQQRFDTIAAFGFPRLITPNLDKLATEGMIFDNCFCTAPSCMPSRASLFNCKYPGRTQVFNNCNAWDNSWVTELQKAGYHCVNVGKMHTFPYDTPLGFHQRYVVENKDRPKDRMGFPNTCGRFNDELDKFLLWNGQKKKTRWEYKDTYPTYDTALGAFEWHMEEKYHPDTFVGNMTKVLVKSRKTNEPLFLQIGFPGPHPPYDPPQRFIDMYEGVDFSVEPVSEEEMVLQTEAHKAFRERLHTNNMDAIKWPENPTAEQLGRLRKYYMANVTLIDEQIGEIILTLGRLGYLENAIVFFTSDHGDCLGDHGLMAKWNMYDCVTRLPAILWSSNGLVPSGVRTGALLQHFDVAHTVLDLAGVSPGRNYQSISFADEIKSGSVTGRKFVYAEHSCDPVFSDNEFITMIRNKEYKLVHYLNDDMGELYDLTNDPDEKCNIWTNPSYTEIKNSLIFQLLNFKCEHHISGI